LIFRKFRLRKDGIPFLILRGFCPHRFDLPDFEFAFFHFRRHEPAILRLPLDFSQQFLGNFLALILQLRFRLLQHDQFATLVHRAGRFGRRPMPERTREQHRQRGCQQRHCFLVHVMGHPAKTMLYLICHPV
jgi:hypothetical protein